MNQQNKPFAQTIKHKNSKFDLKVKYQSVGGEQKIDIYLKSFAGKDLVNYKSTFTNQTISQEIISIFARLDIVFQCFRDEQSFEVNIGNGKIFLKGIFQIKGRKIQRKAQLALQKYDISEYQSMFDQIQQLENELQSFKKLQSQTQIGIIKRLQQKYLQQKKKFEQIIKTKEESELRLKTKQKSLQNQIMELKTEINVLMKKIESFAHQHFVQFKQLKQKVQLFQKLINIKNQQAEYLVQLKKGLEGRKIKKTEIAASSLNQNMKQNNKLNDNIEKQDKKNMIKSATIPKISGHKFVDEKSQHFHKFQINDAFITYVGQSGLGTKLLMNIIIPRQKKYQFEFKIVKTKSKAIIIGVIDQQDVQKFGFSSKRQVSYLGKTGYIEGAEKINGKGFKEGDIVHVTVLLNAPLIQWRVNGVVQARSQPEFFKDETKSFVPFLEMETKYDCVMWGPSIGC